MMTARAVVPLSHIRAKLPRIGFFWASVLFVAKREEESRGVLVAAVGGPRRVRGVAKDDVVT